METAKYKMVFSNNKKNKGAGSILFSGDLTLKHIKEIYSGLLESTKNCKQLNITIKDIDNLDITFIQLIHALKMNVKKVDVNADLPGPIRAILINAGLDNILETKFS